MKIIIIDPRNCSKWKFANRSFFEYGYINDLAEDIKKNGQIEPVYARELKTGKYKYEVIAGSRRLQACLNSGLMLKAYICDVSDKEASIIQEKENDKFPISDYSKGISYHKMQEGLSLTQSELTAMLGLSKRKLQNYLSFAKVDASIWDAVSNMSKVSAKSAETIQLLSRKSIKHKEALIEIAEDIKKGMGSRKIEQMVSNIIMGSKVEKNYESIESDDGVLLASWENNKLRFSKNINFDKKKIAKLLIEFFSDSRNIE